MGDSVLVALVNGKEVKVLYTTKFYPGHCDILSDKTSPFLTNQFDKVNSITVHSELERGFELSEIATSVITS